MVVSCGLLEGSRYDIGFKDASGNDIGLILVRDKNNIPLYKEWSDAAVANQYSVGQTDYSSLEPQKELQFGGDNFIQGFGREYFDPSAPRKYYTGTNIDARFKNQVICSPLASTCTKPSDSDVPTILNADMELDASWTQGAATTSRSSTQKHGGTYSWRCAGGANPAWAYQDLDFTKVAKLATYTFKCWVWCAAGATSAKIQIDDGIATQDSSYVTPDSAWHQLSVSITIAVNATRLRLMIYQHSGTSEYGYFDDATIETASITTNLGTTPCFAEYNDNLYASFGKVLGKLNATGTAYIPVALLPYTITGLTPFTDDRLYIFQGSSGVYYYMTTAEVVAQSNSTKQFATAIGTTLYSVVLPRSVYTATAPTTDAGWSSATVVGSSDYNINELLGVAGIPYVLKEDMTYYIDSTGAVKALAPQLRSERSTTSGLNAIEWQGNIYIPCGAQALYEYDTGVSQLNDISPSKYVTNSTDFDGRIEAMDGDSNYLFVIMGNDTKIEVLAGRWETISGSLSWVWHTLSELTLTGCAKCFASSVYKRRLWISSTSASDSLYYYPLTSMYGNITADTDYTYQTGGNLITPFMYTDLRSDSKGFYKISLTMSDTTATVYWRAYYQMLGGNWTEINSTNKFKTSPVTTAYLPVETTTSNKPASTMIRFKFEAVTGSTSTTPKLLAYDVRALWFPPIKTIITCQVNVADGLILRNGQKDEDQNAATIRTALNAWANPTTAWVRAVYPLYWASASDTVYGKLLPTTGVAFCQPTKFEENKGAIEWNYFLTILLVSGLTF